jgi:hypothetical protein
MNKTAGQIDIQPVQDRAAGLPGGHGSGGRPEPRGG